MERQRVFCSVIYRTRREREKQGKFVVQLQAQLHINNESLDSVKVKSVHLMLADLHLGAKCEEVLRCNMISIQDVRVHTWVRVHVQRRSEFCLFSFALELQHSRSQNVMVVYSLLFSTAN